MILRIAWLTFLAIWFAPWVAVVGGISMMAEVVCETRGRLR